MGQTLYAPRNAVQGQTPVRGSDPEEVSALGLVRVFLGRQLQRALQRRLEVPLLNRRRPLHELVQPWQVRSLVHLADDLPVADLAGLGHRQELEAVELVGVATE